MRIYCRTIFEALKDIQGKKFIPQIMPHKEVKILKKGLTPVRDIDDEIVIYKIGKPNDRLTDASGYDEVLDKMSFEKKSAGNRNGRDIFRTDELFDLKRDSRYISSREQYDINDIFIPRKNIKGKYSGGCIGVHYAPDTKFTDERASNTLDFMHLLDDILPNTWDKQIKLGTDELRSIAGEAAALMHINNIPLPNIIKTLEKSVLQNPKTAGQPSIDLFKFLAKYPNMRKKAVLKFPDGKEILDRNYVRYYSAFIHRFDENTAKHLMEECRKTDSVSGLKPVDESLCETVCLLKPKYIRSGQTIPQPVVVKYEWTKKDTEILEKIKKEDAGRPGQEYFNTLKELFQDGKDTEYVFAHIDKLAKYKRARNDIASDLKAVFGENSKNAKERILKILDKEYEKLRISGSNSSNDTRMLNYITSVTGKIRNSNMLSETITAYERLSKLFLHDEKLMNAAVKLCETDTKNYTHISSSLSRLLEAAVKNTGKLDKNTVDFINKVKNDTLGREKTNTLLDYMTWYKKETPMIMENYKEIFNRLHLIDEINRKIEKNFGMHTMFDMNHALRAEMSETLFRKDFNGEKSRLIELLKPLTKPSKEKHNQYYDKIFNAVYHSVGINEQAVEFINKIRTHKLTEKQIKSLAYKTDSNRDSYYSMKKWFDDIDGVLADMDKEAAKSGRKIETSKTVKLDKTTESPQSPQNTAANNEFLEASDVHLIHNVNDGTEVTLPSGARMIRKPDGNIVVFLDKKGK